MNNTTTTPNPTEQNPQPPGPPARPEWIRLPLRGPCPWTGLSRSKMYGLILPCEANGFKAPVRSVRLSPPGSTKGVRLIHLESLLSYLDELSKAETQNPQPTDS